MISFSFPNFWIEYGSGNLGVYICDVNIDKSFKISTKDELIIDNPHS